MGDNTNIESVTAMAEEKLTPDERLNDSLPLDFEQRQRASALAEDIGGDNEWAAAAEIIYLRDEVASLKAAVRVKDADFQRVYADREHIRDRALQLESAVCAMTAVSEPSAGGQP